MDNLVTIIVPVYNVKVYLKRCMNSILKQTYHNLEILLIDDGSTDGSGQMCDDYAEKDRRVRVVHTENRGLGLARNKGLLEMHGNWVLFVDADDYIDFNMIERMLRKAITFKTEVCFCGFKMVNDRGEIKDRGNHWKKSVYNGEQVITEIFANMLGLPTKESRSGALSLSACRTLFLTDFLTRHHLRFISEKKLISEDVIFCLDYFSVLNRASIEGQVSYYYCQNMNNTLSRKYRKDRLIQNKILYRACLSRIRFYPHKRWLRLGFDKMLLSSVRVCAKQVSREKKDLAYHEIRKMCQDTTVQQVNRRCMHYLDNNFQRIFSLCILWKQPYLLYFLSILASKK